MRSLLSFASGRRIVIHAAVTVAVACYSISVFAHGEDSKRSDAISVAADAASMACEPPSDGRGSSDYKRALIRKLFTEAVDVAARRARGEAVEVSHHYA